MFPSTEASANLDGQAVVEHTFSLPISAQRSVTEQLMLNFKTIGTKATNQDGERMDMVIIYIKSTEWACLLCVEEREVTDEMMMIMTTILLK